MSLARLEGKPLGMIEAAGSLVALLERWTAEEIILRRRGAGGQADLLASCIMDLRAAVEAEGLEELTVKEAAAESGMSEKGIYKALTDNRLANAGTPGRPRVRRCDLPRKARPGKLGPDLVGEALGLVE